VAVLRRYGLWEEVPPHLRSAVLRSPDTVKPGDPLLERVHNVVVASNLQSLLAASQHLADRGFNVVILSAALEGGGEGSRPRLGLRGVVWTSGEAASGSAGRRGDRGAGEGPRRRREEPRAVPLLCRSRQGPPRVCGLHGDRRRRRQQHRGRGAGRRIHGGGGGEGRPHPLEHLDDNDSYTLFHKLGRAIYTGSTGTNVNDIFIALVYKT
jgi:glycerate 2-kinase